MDHVLCFLIYMITAFSRLAKPLSRLFPGTYEEWGPGKPKKILLVGYNGVRNTGSDVRTVSIARQLKELFGPDEIRITVMTMDPGTMEGYFDEDAELFPFSSFFPLDLYRACCTHHAAILCEGSTLKSTFANALTLFHCEAAGIMAAQHKPCIAYGSEVGYMDPFLRRAVRRLCRHTCFITRTEDSLSALEKLGLKGRAGTDAAWFYEGAVSAAEAGDLLKRQGWDGKKPLLGIAVIDPFCWPVRPSLLKWVKGILQRDLSGQYDKWYFFSTSPKRRKAFRRYLREVADGADLFLQNHDYYPVVIGMERLDAKACRILKKQLHRPGAMFLSGEHSAAEMTGILRSLSALVTSRYHAAVLSMETGCPILGVSMDERLDSLLKELSFDGKYLFHTTDKDLGRKIGTALEEACAEQEVIRRQIRSRVSIDREKIRRMGVILKKVIREIQR